MKTGANQILIPHIAVTAIMTSGITAMLKIVLVTNAEVAVSLSPPKLSAIATTEAAGDIAIAIIGAK